jgi:1-acyl-sn-glycerol-3-phosphate acyltransferase
MFHVSSSTSAATVASPLPAQQITAARILYGIYAWLQFMLLGVVALLGLLVLEPLERRRRWVRGAARIALTLAGMRVRTQGISQLPPACVVVANHCSYLDGVLLAAVLPSRFGFVIKREMARVPLVGMLLRRIGVEFVERRAGHQLMRDTRRLLRQAQRGESLVFFPEGTFEPAIGLLRFHIGAFAAAARANLPVVPMAIRGTRCCLPPGGPWPAPGRIEVRALPAVSELPGQRCAAASQGERARQLRARARTALLDELGEPDLDPPTPAETPSS